MQPTIMSRSHGPRGNAFLDAPRRLVTERCGRGASKTAFPRGPWERVSYCYIIIFINLAIGRTATAGAPEKAKPSHWSFARPNRPPLPPVQSRGWVRNPIDTFILSALEENGLRPAKEADRATLLRRVTFDLTGLPPSPSEIDAFLSDKRPDAYERVVDRLLSSPRFGERWAQHWLDLARYADTDGFEFDQVRPDAWRYRDWVVSALNADLPYDRFLKLQLAGDETAPGDAQNMIATGFTRCYPDMVDLNDQGLRRQNALNDITETTGLVFLGLTIGCARCHDHKFDPIKIDDFYSLQAFFTPARFRDDLPLGSASERRDFETRKAADEARLNTLRTAVVAFESSAHRLLDLKMSTGLDDETILAIGKDDDERSPRELRLVYDAYAKDKRIPAKFWKLALEPWTFAIRADVLAQLERQKKAEPTLIPQVRGVDEAGPNAPATYILRRGEYSMRGAEVKPQAPGVLQAAGGDVAIKALPRSTGRRTALANWLADTDNPLTSRVMVNRLWQHHFGRGIVATASDFGTMGAEPSHPELLDWLATELTSRNWSLKDLHRLMVTSATYRQSSHVPQTTIDADPENELWSRFRRARLDGEAIRDTLLSVSGKLSASLGGPPVFPELPAELTKLSSKGAVWPVSVTEEERSRRSLYVFIRRNLRYPFFEAFDRPDTNASCPQRGTTTIAPQALTLLNSKLAHNAARAMAARVAKATKSRESQIREVFRLAYSRAPDDIEMRMATGFLDVDPSLERFCLAVINANEFVYVD